MTEHTHISADLPVAVCATCCAIIHLDLIRKHGAWHNEMDRMTLAILKSMK